MTSSPTQSRRARARPPATAKAPPAKPAKPWHAKIPRGATLQRKRVQCGKRGCKRWHGPYWYAFWKAGGATRCAYVGSDARLAELLRARAGEVDDALERDGRSASAPPATKTARELRCSGCRTRWSFRWTSDKRTGRPLCGECARARGRKGIA